MRGNSLHRLKIEWAIVPSLPSSGGESARSAFAIVASADAVAASHGSRGFGRDFSLADDHR